MSENIPTRLKKTPSLRQTTSLEKGGAKPPGMGKPPSGSNGLPMLENGDAVMEPESNDAGDRTAEEVLDAVEQERRCESRTSSATVCMRVSQPIPFHPKSIAENHLSDLAGFQLHGEETDPRRCVAGHGGHGPR